MPTFIKTGYWESAVKSYKGWLNLEDLISGIAISGSGTAGQIAFWTNTSVQSGSNSLFWDNINNRLAIGSAPLTADFEINKNSAVSQAYRNSNNGVNLSTGASVYQLDILGRRNGADATFARMQVVYNGNGITRRGKLLFGVAETSGFGGYNLMLSQTSGNIKVVNIGNNSAAYLDNDTTITTAYAQHAQVVVAATTTLPLMSWDINGVVQNVMFSDGNLALNSTSNLGFKLDVNGTARVQGSLIATGTSYISSISTIGTYNAFSTFNVVNDGPASIAVDRFSNNGTSPHFNLRKSRGTSVIPAIVQTNDELGYVGFWGHDGTSFQRNGIILVQANSVTGSVISPVMRFGVGSSAGTSQYYISLFNSGNTVFGSGAADITSAIVNIESTTKGFLPPRMTTAQKNLIGTPAAGLVIYDTDLNKLCVYTGATWQTITSA